METKYPNLKNQKSVSKIFQKGDRLRDDGMIWIDDAIEQLSEEKIYGNKVYERDRFVTQKFKITITKL